MNDSPKPSIMCVDDDADLRDWLEAVLTGHGWNVVTVDGGRRALEEAQKRPTDVILLDATMPDLNGYEVCAKLQELKITASTPVIFATSLGTDQDKVKAFQVGAAD